MDAQHCVVIFIRKTTRKYKGRVYTNYLLVRSLQTPKGPRQKVVCSLGDLSARPAGQRRGLGHQVEDALRRQPGLFAEGREPEVEPIVRQVRQREAATVVRTRGRRGAAAEDLIVVHADRVKVECSREAETVHVGYQFWKRLGLPDILRGQGFSERAILLTCAMTLNRLIHPASEHTMPAWIRSTALEDLWGMDFQTLGTELDRLKARVGLPPEATVVVDQGMVYAENLQ